MSFDALPNEMLDIILNQNNNFSLKERIQMRAVSPRCLSVIEDSLKKETKLVLRDNFKYTKIPKKPDDLVVSDLKYFDTELFQLLAYLFPLVSELSIDFKSIQYFCLPSLLFKYSSTLQSLSLNGRFSYSGYMMPILNSDPATCAQLAEAINSLTSLTSLELRADIELFKRLLPSLAATLAQLERFALSCYWNVHTAFSDGEWSLVRNSIDHLSDRCTHLKLGVSNFKWLNIDQIKQKLPALTSLIVNFNSRTPYCLTTDVFQKLSRLQLTELRLNNITFIKDTFKRPDATIDQPLSSVKHLRFIYKPLIEAFDGHYFCATIAAWFPSLEQLTIKCAEGYHAEIKVNLDQFSNSPDVCILGLY